MLKIFRYLFKHWVTILAVVALLLVQAGCDLALPGYTSDIVDVGIQQGGVDSAVPDPVRDSTLQALERMMSAEQAALVERSYAAPDADGLRRLDPDAGTAAGELEQAFTTPDVALYLAAAAQSAGRQGVETALPEPRDLDAAAVSIAAATADATPDFSALQGQMTAAGTASCLSTVAGVGMTTATAMALSLSTAAAADTTTGTATAGRVFHGRWRWPSPSSWRDCCLKICIPRPRCWQPMCWQALPPSGRR